MNIIIHRQLVIALLCTTFAAYGLQPLGMFAPYDINIKQKKSAPGHFQFSVFGEKSYTVRGYATDIKEETTSVVNVLEIYEPKQNIVALYQGFDANGAVIQTISTPFTQLLDSIAGGPGGGVSDQNNGIYTPTGNLSCGQVSFGTTYSAGQYFYLSAYIPVCFAQLTDVKWDYSGTNKLFSDQKIHETLISTFSQDAEKYFDLHTGNWKRQGFGDLALIAEWQRDFAQRRPTLRNVQVNARVGLTLPTSLKTCDRVIMPVSFGADGAVGIPFGGGLSLNLGNAVEIGFSGQFWYYWSNEKLRRIKTFPTQTALLYPILTKTNKQYSIIQNFNLHGMIYSFCKRFTLKGFYQYWRKGKDTLIPQSSNFNYDVVNSAPSIDEETRHQFCVLAAYSPHADEFKRCIPQFELFWKTATNGTRTAVASTFGGQIVLTF